MRHLDNVVRHSNLHIRQARSMLPRDARWKMGAQLVTRLRKLIREKESANCKGVAALKRGGTVRRMWVSKSNTGDLRKGQQVHSRKAMELFSARGAKFREILYPRDKEVKDALSDMARVIAPLHHQRQYGFIPKRNCVQSAAEHCYARTVYLLDIENAFCQISAREVQEILQKVFYVNAFEASVITDLCAPYGYLYQGNPMSPALFNIRALWMVERLGRLCESNGAVLSVYADDVTISHDRWDHISAGFRKTVLRIIRECGLEVNPSKCKVRRVSPLKIGGFDITGLAIDFDEFGQPYVRPLHRRLYRRKAAYLEHMREMGFELSSELCKDGKPKKLRWVIEGLAIWGDTEGKPEASHQLPLELGLPEQVHQAC